MSTIDCPKKQGLADLLLSLIKGMILNSRLDDSTMVTALSLIYFKKNLGSLITLLDNMPVDLYELIVGFFVDFKLNNLFTPNTFNSIMHNRESIFKSFLSMTSLHNLGNMDSTKYESSLFKLTKSPTDDFTKHVVVFRKIEVYNILSNFFVKDTDISLDLCIAMDNLFMIPGYWIADCVVSTNLINTCSILNKHSSAHFFLTNDKYQIPWYSINILPFKYSMNFANKLKKAILLAVSSKAQLIKSSFDIDQETLIQILQLCHNYLSFALGPALMCTTDALVTVIKFFYT